MDTHSPKFNSHEAFAEWFNDNVSDICDIEEQGKDPEEVMKLWCSKNKHRYEEDGVYNDNIQNTITEKKQKGKKIIIRKPNKKKVNEATKLTRQNTESKEEKMTEATTLECYNCEKKCDEEKMPYSKVWIGKVCDECYEEEEEEVEPIHGDEDEDGDIYCGGCSKFRSVSDFERDLKDAYCIECEEEEEEEETICSKCPLPLTEDDMAMGDGTICESCLEEQEDTSFGTAYHDGSGFADCDPTGKGYKKCKEEGWSKDKWCSECVYLDTRQEEQLADQEVKSEYEKFKEQVNKDYTTALAYAFGISNGFSQKCVRKYGFGDSVSDEIETFMDSVDDVIKKEWRIKIFNHFYGYDYVWFNGEPLERDYFEGEYPKMVDKEGNKIIQLETGEYITQKKKIKLNKKKITLNVVKKLSEDPKFIKKLADEIGEENEKYY